MYIAIEKKPIVVASILEKAPGTDTKIILGETNIGGIL
jgi:hypothetical protein